MPAPLIGITTLRTQAGAESVSLSAAYLQAVRLAGGAPVLIPSEMNPSELRCVYDRIDALLLSGGGDVDPARYGESRSAAVREVDGHRDEAEIRLIGWAVEEGKPILGICRGQQILNVALGGSLIQDLPVGQGSPAPHDQPDSPESPGHPLRVSAETRLKSMLGCDSVHANSHHHQAVGRLAPGVIAAGRAPDGVIEALEIPSHPFAVSVQWHPERMLDAACMLALFRGLVGAAGGG